MLLRYLLIFKDKYSLTGGDLYFIFIGAFFNMIVLLGILLFFWKHIM